jgi:hypothetical protein
MYLPRSQLETSSGTPRAGLAFASSPHRSFQPPAVRLILEYKTKRRIVQVPPAWTYRFNLRNWQKRPAAVSTRRAQPGMVPNNWKTEANM